MRASDPSERDYEIFCAIEFDHVSLRAAAEQWELSPTRIGQIVAQVRSWYIGSTPAWVREVNGAVQPLVACRRHDQQLQHLTTAAVQAWQSSKGEVTTRHGREGALTATLTTSISQGQTRYLAAAARLSEMRIRAAERLAKIMTTICAEEVPVAPPEMPCAREETGESPAPCAVEAATVVSIVAQETCELVQEVASVPMFARPDSPTPVRAKLDRKLSRKKRRQLSRGKRQVG